MSMSVESEYDGKLNTTERKQLYGENKTGIKTWKKGTIHSFLLTEIFKLIHTNLLISVNTSHFYLFHFIFTYYPFYYKSSC